jgi:WD40 repeat protein
MLKYILIFILALSMPKISFAASPDQPILWTIASSENGKYFASGSSDGVLIIYQSKSNKVIESFKFPNNVRDLDTEKK